MPLFGPSTGVVVTTKFPSKSVSPAFVKSPVAVPSSLIVCVSLSTTGPSFIGLTVTVKFAEFEVAPALSVIVY